LSVYIFHSALLTAVLIAVGCCSAN